MDKGMEHILDLALYGAIAHGARTRLELLHHLASPAALEDDVRAAIDRAMNGGIPGVVVSLEVHDLEPQLHLRAQAPGPGWSKGAEYAFPERMVAAPHSLREQQESMFVQDSDPYRKR